MQVIRRCSVKKVVLKNFADFTGKHLCWSLFLIKLYAPCNCKNNFFYRTPPVTASVYQNTEA